VVIEGRNRLQNRLADFSGPLGFNAGTFVGRVQFVKKILGTTHAAILHNGPGRCHPGL
jgi:hypothetical protein